GEWGGGGGGTGNPAPPPHLFRSGSSEAGGEVAGELGDSTARAVVDVGLATVGVTAADPVRGHAGGGPVVEPENVARRNVDGLARAGRRADAGEHQGLTFGG